jgi:ATP-dependent DNA helicase RecG
MRDFRDRRLDILVSTAVVEVGVDIPNATVMMVEGAERFGLAQLHQLRGRVGRSDIQSYCLLLSDSPAPDARERLQIVERTQDGFALAEQDLRLRGPGEFFGTRQSGLPDLKVAQLSDVPLIELARTEATRLLDSDADLARPEHAQLKEEVSRLWERVTAEAH